MNIHENPYKIKVNEDSTIRFNLGNSVLGNGTINDITLGIITRAINFDISSFYSGSYNSSKPLTVIVSGNPRTNFKDMYFISEYLRKILDDKVSIPLRINSINETLERKLSDEKSAKIKKLYDFKGK